MQSSSYHISNLGAFASSAIPRDRDGYVHLTAQAWSESADAHEVEGEDLLEWSEEQAANARRETDAANAAAADWERNNG